MGYIGSGPTRFNTADELTVTGDAEIGGIATVDALKLSETDVLLSAGETAIITSSNDVQIIRDGSIKITATATGMDVTGTVTADGLTVSGDAVFEPDNDGVRITGANYATLRLEENDTTDLNTTLFNSGGKFSIYTSSDDRASATERVTLDHSTGNVGIGTSSPGELLHLSLPSGTNGDIVRFSRSAGAYSFQLGVSSGATSNLYISDSSNNNIIDFTSSGNVGIGTSSPATRLDIVDSASSTVPLRIETNGGSANTVRPQISMFSGGSNGYHISTIRSNISNDPYGLVFTENTTERMRIDSNGSLRLNTQQHFASSAEKLTIVGNSNNQYDACLVMKSGYATGTTSVNGVYFINNADGTAGYISWNGTSTSYNTSSDYRLKTAVTYDWDATSRLKQLKPARFEWIADGDDAVPVDGFLAHEVQDIVPEAIIGTKDGMRDEEYQVSAATGDIYTPAAEATFDDDGNEVTAATDEVIHSTDVVQPETLAEGQQWRETTAAVMGTRSVPDYQGIDQSKLVPLLVKTIQELEARITALEA
jgi:hypothetical protein